MRSAGAREDLPGATDEEGLPVLDSDGEVLVGWLTHRLLLRAYHAHLDQR